MFGFRDLLVGDPTGLRGLSVLDAHCAILCVAQARTETAWRRGIWSSREQLCFQSTCWLYAEWVHPCPQEACRPCGKRKIQQAPLTRCHPYWEPAGSPAGCWPCWGAQPQARLSFSSDLSGSMALASLEARGSRSNKSVMTSSTCPYFVYSIDISLR